MCDIVRPVLEVSVVDVKKIRKLKASIGHIMREKAFIREKGEPIWVSDIVLSLEAIGKKEEAATLEQLIDEGLARPGTRIDELSRLIRKLLNF